MVFSFVLKVAIGASLLILVLGAIVIFITNSFDDLRVLIDSEYRILERIRKVPEVPYSILGTWVVHNNQPAKVTQVGIRNGETVLKVLPCELNAEETGWLSYNLVANKCKFRKAEETCTKPKAGYLFGLGDKQMVLLGALSDGSRVFYILPKDDEVDFNKMLDNKEYRFSIDVKYHYKKKIWNAVELYKLKEMQEFSMIYIDSVEEKSTMAFPYDIPIMFVSAIEAERLEKWFYKE